MADDDQCTKDLGARMVKLNDVFDFDNDYFVHSLPHTLEDKEIMVEDNPAGFD